MSDDDLKMVIQERLNRTMSQSSVYGLSAVWDAYQVALEDCGGEHTDEMIVWTSGMGEHCQDELDDKC